MSRMLRVAAILAVMLVPSLSDYHPDAALAASEEPTADSGESPLLRFPVISDVHVNEYNPAAQSKFRAALQDLYAVAPDADALIINGDLTTEGTEPQYDMLNAILAEVPHAPVHTTMGNHEYYKAWVDEQGAWNPDGFPNGETETMSINRYLAKTGTESLYNDEWIGDYHFVFLGSEQYRQSDPTNAEDAYLSETQLQWLEGKLAEGASSDKPIFVFLHQPLPYTLSGSSIPINNRAVVQHERLMEILSQYPQVIFFSGHTHWSLNMPTTIAKKRFTMFNTSTVWDPLNASDTSIGPNESEGLYVEVYADKVVVKGRDFYRRQWIEGQTHEVHYMPKPDLLDYDFAESAVQDSSHSANHGTAVGEPRIAYDASFRKNVLALDGASYVRIPDNEGLRPEQLTMAASFALDTLDGYQDIVAKNQTSDYGFEFNPDSGRLEAWLYIIGDGGAGYVVTQTPVLEANRVYEAAVTYDGQRVALYLDGARVDTADAAGRLGQAGTPVDLAIGADPEPDNGARSFFHGKIGYVRIYAKALTEAQITGVGRTDDKQKPVWPAEAALSAAAVTPFSLDLSWSAASDNVSVSNYRLYVNGSLLRTVEGTAQTVRIPGLQPDTSYAFKVEAGDEAGNWTDDGPALTASTLPYAHEEVGPPDLLHYTFEESATKDASPAGNDGTIVGHASVTYDEAFGRPVLHLDGDSSYIRVPDNAGLRPEKLTLTAAFSLDSLQGTQDIVAKNQSSDYGFEFNPATGKLESWTYIVGPQGSGYVVLESDKLAVNQVYHAVVTYDGYENALYVNGVKTDAVWKEGIVGQADIVDLAIGADPEKDGGARSFFSGKVGLVQLYSFPLTEGQVHTLYGQFANPLASVLLEQPPQMTEGDTHRLALEAVYMDGTTDHPSTGVAYASSEPSVALVNPVTGAVTAAAPGRTVITASYKGLQAEAVVTVKPWQLASVSLELDPSVIWPPNGAMTPVHASIATEGMRTISRM
jgi:3',5'-cyclic-AMP phosphodiesterase